MNRSGRPLALALLLAALVVPASKGQQSTPPATPDRPGPLAPEFFDLVRRTLGELRDDLREAEPGITADALRGRLLVEAYELINNVTNLGLAPEDLLELPMPLRDDASRLVAELLGEAPPPSSPEPNEPVPGDRPVPVRVRPYATMIEDYLRTRFEELSRSGAPDAADRLRQDALDVVAGAACPSNDPRDLTADERAFAERLARDISGQGGLRSRPDERAALQDDIDALLELLRRKNTDLRLKEGVQGIADRADRLESYGLGLLQDAIAKRDPNGEVPESASKQVRAMADLIARGVPFSSEPEGPEPVVGTTDEPAPPPDGPPPIDPGLLPGALGLARAIDRGLIAAGVDLSTRRETLRRFVREHVARKAGIDAAALPPEVVAEAERAIEQILAEGPDPTAPAPQVVRPPVVTIPPVTVPTVLPPTTILVPRPRHPWLHRHR